MMDDYSVSYLSHIWLNIKFLDPASSGVWVLSSVFILSCGSDVWLVFYMYGVIFSGWKLRKMNAILCQELKKVFFSAKGSLFFQEDKYGLLLKRAWNIEHKLLFSLSFPTIRQCKFGWGKFKVYVNIIWCGIFDYNTGRFKKNVTIFEYHYPG